MLLSTPQPAEQGSDDLDEIERCARAAAEATSAEGRKAALSTLYAALRDPVIRDIRARVDSMATAEDLAQETWVRVARSIGQYASRPGRSSGFVPWLFTISRNLVVDHYRAAGRRTQEILSATPVAADVPSEDESPERLAERREVASALKQYLAKLPERQREAVYLRVCVGLNTAQTAQVLSTRLRPTSEGAVRVLLNRGLRKLSKILPADEVAHKLAEPPLAPALLAEESAAGDVIRV
ncbi:RNA polymerase sigma factor [Streptomyces sp. MJM8645]|uniref:RNA polymerase sigma factor n=1 Tax=Streptomycetaceae TaxID=2062 RepID=UPI000A91CB65|nr:RNA polymerase sigma factor [Streptomyces sp. MJM8645]